MALVENFAGGLNLDPLRVRPTSELPCYSLQLQYSLEGGRGACRADCRDKRDLQGALQAKLSAHGRGSGLLGGCGSCWLHRLRLGGHLGLDGVDDGQQMLQLPGRDPQLHGQQCMGSVFPDPSLMVILLFFPKKDGCSRQGHAGRLQCKMQGHYSVLISRC